MIENIRAQFFPCYNVPAEQLFYADNHLNWQQFGVSHRVISDR